MIIFPAIDIIKGKPVRLFKGDFSTAEQVADDVLETADGFVKAGAQWVHMVDLDGSLQKKRANEKVFTEENRTCVSEPLKYIGKVDNAGSVFLGNFSPEPLGDYFAGPNHVLPTSGTARFFSPLGVDSFVKKSSFIYYTPQELSKAKDDIITLAESEGLTAHANSISVRFK